MRGSVRATIALLFTVTAVGCAPVTEMHPAGPPPRWSEPYAGRIVLSASSLHRDVERFETPWSRRLAILGLHTRIAYDDVRAVFDVFGAAPSVLDGVATALTDPGGWRLGSVPLGRAFVEQWLPATAGCDCVGQMQVTSGASAQACGLGTGGPVPLARADAPVYAVDLRVRWRSYVKNEKGEEVVDERDTPDLTVSCPKERWPVVTVKLRPGTTAAQATAIALALGGDDLPALPRVESVSPAGVGRP